MAETRRTFGRDSREGAVRLVLFKPLTQPEIERIADLRQPLAPDNNKAPSSHK